MSSNITMEVFGSAVDEVVQVPLNSAKVVLTIDVADFPVDRGDVYVSS